MRSSGKPAVRDLECCQMENFLPYYPPHPIPPEIKTHTTVLWGLYFILQIPSLGPVDLCTTVRT